MPFIRTVNIHMYTYESVMAANFQHGDMKAAKWGNLHSWSRRLGLGINQRKVFLANSSSCLWDFSMTNAGLTHGINYKEVTLWH